MGKKIQQHTVLTPNTVLHVDNKTKKVRKKADKVRLVVEPDGQIKLKGRPAWPTRAKKIKVNQVASLGEVEDRRHLLHWDEQLKPVLGRVFTAMRQDCSSTLVASLTEPLTRRGWSRLSKDADGLMERVATEINGAQKNLVPDRADINKAIEHVRGNLRKVQAALQSDQGFADEFSSGPDTPNDSRMKRYQALARTHLPTDRMDTPIVSRISEIHAMLLQNIDGCLSPSSLWLLLNDMAYSVTFDLSGKALREKTSAALHWQTKMALNFGEPGPAQYEDLLSLLD